MKESRLNLSLKNARINIIFYFLSLVLSFFSRKIFLEALGNEFIGLIGTLQNILGFLNLAELGIGTAIGYLLYQPIFDQDKKVISEIITVLGYLYRQIGKIIIGAGIILAIFLPLIFKKSDFQLTVIIWAYFVFLSSSLVGYFVNFRQALFSADQKNYIVNAYFQTGNIVKTILQIVIAYYTHNYFLWITIEIVFSILYSYLINRKINQSYPWLDTRIKNGRELLKKYPDVIRYTKQLFIHRIATFIQSQTASILIYGFVSLKVVAFYGNYMVIINKLCLLVNNLMDGINAGVGNLVAEGDFKKIQQVYWELMAIKYFVSAILVFALYYLIDPFILIWVGEEYVLPKSVLIIMLVTLYLSQTHGANYLFINGYGLFSDVWAPLTEAILSFSVSIIAGHYLKLEGVLLGPLISLFLIIGIWKPYLLFHKGFKLSVLIYWLHVFKFWIILAVGWLVSEFLIVKLNEVTISGFISWGTYALVSCGIFSLIEFLLFYFFSKGMRHAVVRLRRRFF